MTEIREQIRKDTLIRQVDDRKASPTFLNLQTSNQASASFTLEANGDPADQVVVTMTLSNNKGLKLFAVPLFTVYKDSVSDSNRIPEGSAVSEEDFHFLSWIDYDSSDGNNMKLKYFIKNMSGSSKAIVFRGLWRFMVEDAA